MLKVRIKEIKLSRDFGSDVELKGWVRTRRDSKQGFSFIELNDGSCMSSIQIVVDADTPGYETSIKDVTTGASIAVTGQVKESPGKGQKFEVQATSPSMTLSMPSWGSSSDMRSRRYLFSTLYSASS